MKNLSLLNDVVFKIVFGSEKHSPVLRALLNALLGLEGEDRIAELSVLNPDLDKAHLFDKGVILDVKARDSRRRELRGRFEKWLHVLKFGELYEPGTDQLPPELREEEGIEMALEAMWDVSSSEQVRELVEARMKARRDWAWMMDEAERKGLEKGRVDFLAGLLEARFGPVSEETRKRLEAATERELLDWGRRLLRAESLEAVFSADTEA